MDDENFSFGWSNGDDDPEMIRAMLAVHEREGARIVALMTPEQCADFMAMDCGNWGFLPHGSSPVWAELGLANPLRLAPGGYRLTPAGFNAIRILICR